MISRGSSLEPAMAKWPGLRQFRAGAGIKPSPWALCDLPRHPGVPMPRLRKQLPAQVGAGELRYRGFHGPVDYEVLGEPASLRLGPLRLRGSFTATPEVA